MKMKSMAIDYFVGTQVEDQDGSSSMGMDIDDIEALEFLGGEGPLGVDHHRLAHTDFFNNFEDDFDDSDIN